MSGTPALSRPNEIYPQVSPLEPRQFPPFAEFGRRYCSGHQDRFGFWNYLGASNLHELHLLLENTVMIRRLKSQVLSELPEKTRQKVDFTMNFNQLMYLIDLNWSIRRSC